MFLWLKKVNELSATVNNKTRGRTPAGSVQIV